MLLRNIQIIPMQNSVEHRVLIVELASIYAGYTVRFMIIYSGFRLHFEVIIKTICLGIKITDSLKPKQT